MIEFANDEDRLRYQLLAQPRRFEYRWTQAADCELRQILFRSLAAYKDENLSYFFPHGTPTEQTEPWSLRNAQGAVDGAEYLPSAKGTACGHIFKSGESTYSCKTCQADDTCVLCSKCFESSDHEGHQVYISVSPGNSGCCDCGDKEAWKREVRCSIHTHTIEEEAKPSGKDKVPVASTQLPAELVEAVRTTIAGAVDYLCDVFSCSPEQLRLPKTEDSITRDEKLSRLSSPTYGSDGDDEKDTEYAVMLWNDEKHTVNDVQNQVAMACKRTKSYGLQKAYEVNDNGRAIVHYTTNVAETVRMAQILERIKITVTVRSSRDTFREQMCETIIDWMSDIGGCAVGDDPYLLRNVVCEEFLKPWRLGSAASNKEIGLEGIDDHEYEDTEKLRRRYATLFRPAMGANIIRVQVNADQDDDEDEDEDDFDEEEEVMLNEEEADQMEIEIEDARQPTLEDMDIDYSEEGVDETEAMEAALAGYPPPPPPPPPVQRHRLMTPAESDDGAEEQPRPTSDAPNSRIPKTPNEKVKYKRPLRPSKHWLEKPEGYRAPRPSEPAEDLWQRVRLDWLVLYDLRLWKTLRIKLRHLYITNVATIPHFKRILGLRFAGLYTPLAELYLVADREPDHSIINLSVQMLTTPSITEEVVERGNFLTNLMAILYTFLTTRQVGLPEDCQPKATLAFDAGSVTNRRMFHFFVDMRWLFQSEFIHHKMRTEPRYLLQFLDLVKLHQGICPNVRAVGDHVEYESDAWISASLIIKEIDRLSKAVASSFETNSPELDVHLQRAIRTAAQVTMINSFGYERKRFHAHEIKDDMAWHSVGPFEPEGKTYSVPKYVVLSEPMSFHHPLHYLLSWLLENAKGMDRKEMRALLHFTPEDLKDPYNNARGAPAPQSLSPDELLSGIFDHPLRLCAWLSQMKANMWVRNGITLRHQAHTYRSVSHRDISYQRDIFMIQAGFVLCGSEDEKPGERFLAQTIDRFQMTRWMKGEYAPAEGFEESQQLDILEDLYHLMVVALCERGNLAVPANGEDQSDKILQHDIAHALCFKPLSFSDLGTRVTEKIADSDSFQRVLEDMTIFRAPEGMSDTGTFELKPEFVEIVDPYYAHYSRNHREEAENVHRKHMARKTGKKPEDIVFEPKLQSLEGSLFKDLPTFTKTRLFASTIAAALQYAISAKQVAPKMQATRIETFLHMVLHLSLIAVIEDSAADDGGFVELAASMQHKLQPGSPSTIVSMLIILSEMTEYESCQPAIKHILRKMQLKQPDRLSSAMGPIGSQLDRSNNDSPASLSGEDKEKKKQEALARQARVMAQMKQQQNSFLMNQGLAGFDDGEFEDIEDDMAFNEEPEDLVEQRKVWNFPTGTCILCQEATDDRKLFGTFAFLGESNILRSTPVDDPDFVEEVMEVPENLDQSADHLRPFGVAGKNKHTVQKTTGDGKTAKIERQGLSKGFPHAQHSTRGPVSSSCGHIMHYACFELYLTATQRRHQTQIARSQPETILLKEFICPLCKALGNTFLPIIWKGKQCAHEHELHAAKGFKDWLSESATTYAPDLAWLQNKSSIPYLQQQVQGIYSNRSSDYVESNFGPTLAAALRESPATGQSPLADAPRSSLRRGLSLSSWFRPDRADPEVNEEAPFGMNHSSGEPATPAAELVKAYQRVDETIRINRLGVPTQIEDTKINTVGPLSRALGFTISALEIQLRGVSSNASSPSLLGDLSEQSLTHLRIISETIESYLAVKVLRSSHSSTVARETAIKRDVLSAQLFGVESDYVMADVRSFAGNLLVEDDLFLFFADWLAFFAPSVSEAPNILQLCLWAEIVKVIHVYKNLLKENIIPTPDNTSVDHVIPSEAFAGAVQAVAASDKKDLHASRSFSTAQLKVLYLLVEKYAQVFLRKCVILMHVRYGLDFECPYDLDQEAPELSRLAKLLHIPTFEAQFALFMSRSSAGMQLQTLSQRWISQANIVTEVQQSPATIKLPHPTIYELIGLPKNYDTLTEEAIKRRCPTTGKEITDPAVCLFCAAIFCSQATCCMKGPEHSQRGGCWQHMQKCGGRVGIFINIRKCMVLFLHEPMSGSFAHAPYLDRHGEPDPTLRRHHQLFLNQKRYDKLMREVWLGHGIQTFISRKLEADINPGGWETL
ncbi:hypothetical protein WHR41_00619 [Cladosporium halotolerans]|uniref:E3 ubiquitin-protein ligase n=1 Tax=Cladosporium halotolerans TaxID=1052096 RepID=A0AB34L2G6_9PEZI